MIGFTGTRYGCKSDQYAALQNYLADQPIDSEAHHGDCVGADANFHEICTRLAFRIAVHPPLDATHRAHKQGDETREPKSHFARNRDIVNECDVLIGCPFQMQHQPHGGTWYTIDYAIKQKKPVVIIYPDGSMEFHPADQPRKGE